MGRKTPIAPAVERWDYPVPDPAERHIHVLTPKPGVPIRALIVSDLVVSKLMHWRPPCINRARGQSTPHIDAPGHCEMCQVFNQKPRWHGYLGAWMLDCERYCILDVTLYCVQSCPSLDPKSGEILRGRSILMRRIGKAANSPVVCELGSDQARHKMIPADFAVIHTLHRLWGLYKPGETNPHRVAREDRQA